MGSFIVKQPNGKYARFSAVVDMVTDYDMTEEEYINLCVEKAIEQAKRDAKYVLKNCIHPFEDIIEYWKPYNQDYEQFIQQLEEMGASEEQIYKARKEYETNWRDEQDD